MSGSSTYSITSRRAGSHISLWRMIQPGGMSVQAIYWGNGNTQESFRRMPFTFLGELQRKVQLFHFISVTTFFYALTLLAQFLSSPSASSSSSSLAPHALQSTFGPIISQLVYTYNTSPPTDDISRAQSELAQVKDIMVQNVEQILSRGERIELLVDKTDTMASQATAFRRGARTVRRQMWWKNKRVLGLGVLVALVRTPCFSPLRA
jgi:vesicle-associated membrane protein 7